MPLFLIGRHHDPDMAFSIVDFGGQRIGILRLACALQRHARPFGIGEAVVRQYSDVVPTFEYHYVYDVDFWGDVKYHKGTRIYPDRGDYIHNWPDQQYQCGVAKTKATGRRYKWMVRALKRLENELVRSGKISELPSFFMECLVYNVPNEDFNRPTYMADMRSVLATLLSRCRTKCGTR